MEMSWSGATKINRFFLSKNTPPVCLFIKPLTCGRVAELPGGFYFSCSTSLEVNLHADFTQQFPQTHRRYVNRPLGFFNALRDKDKGLVEVHQVKGEKMRLKEMVETVLSLLTVKKGTRRAGTVQRGHIVEITDRYNLTTPTHGNVADFCCPKA